MTTVRQHHDSPGSDRDRATDPVCGMRFAKRDAAGSEVYLGEQYFFCSGHCLVKFRSNPAAYIGKHADAVDEHAHGPEHAAQVPHTGGAHHHAAHHPSSAISGAPAGPVAVAAQPSTIYTCPMHPEIRQTRPGACPKCGMALEPVVASAEAEVGIAMGTGADVTIQSAGITLVKGDLRGIVRARRLSRATMRHIRENLFLAFYLQRAGRADCRGRAVPVDRPAAQSDDRCGCDEPQFGVGGHQCAEAALSEDLMATTLTARIHAVLKCYPCGVNGRRGVARSNSFFIITTDGGIK